MTSTTWVICVMFATCMVAILPTIHGQKQILSAPVSKCPPKCYAYFGTNYYTFDYTQLDGHYTGQCKHLLAGTCDCHCCNYDSTLIPEFKVYIMNGKTCCLGFTKPKYVEIHQAGNIVRLSRNPLTAEWINNAGSTLTPANSYPNFALDSWSFGNGYKYTGLVGLQVWFHNCGYVEVKVSHEYWNKTCGMCGNYNYNAADDHYTKEGDGETTTTNIANSWVVYDPENYSPPCPPSRRRKRAVTETCDGSDSWYKQCAAITDKYSGSLDSAFLKAQTRECVSNACATRGRSIAEFESYMAAYASLNTEPCLTDADDVRA